MGKPTKDHVAAFQAANTVIWELSSNHCDVCQGQCWTLATTANGWLGNDAWSTWISYRPHMDDVAALAHVAATAGRLGRKVLDRAVHAAMLEIQPELPL